MSPCECQYHDCHAPRRPWFRRDVEGFSYTRCARYRLRRAVYSRYGHGKSERLAENRSVDFMHHEAKVVLPELLRQFEIERPVLLGHSDGASIGLICAGTWPERVRALILERRMYSLRIWVFEASLRFANSTNPAICRISWRVIMIVSMKRFAGWNDIWLDPQFRDWNIEEYLAAIACPTLVIQGEDDEYGTLAQVEAIQRRVSAAQSLILPDCGHSPHRDQPSLTLDAISKFIASL